MWWMWSNCCFRDVSSPKFLMGVILYVPEEDHTNWIGLALKGQHTANIRGCDLLHPPRRDPALIQTRCTSSPSQLAVWLMSQGHKQQVNFLRCRHTHVFVEGLPGNDMLSRGQRCQVSLRWYTHTHSHRHTHANPLSVVSACMYQWGSHAYLCSVLLFQEMILDVILFRFSPHGPHGLSLPVTSERKKETNSSICHQIHQKKLQEKENNLIN